MNNLNPEQKNNFKKAAATQVEDQDMAMFLEMQEMNEKLEVIALKETPQLEIPEFPKVIKAEILGAEIVTIQGKSGAKGEKGDKGDRGETGDSIVGPQGPKGDRGEMGPMGRNGIDGQTIIGPAGENGKDGKDGSPDTGEEIIDKINEAEGLIKKERVEGLSDEVARLEKKINDKPTGGFRASGAMRLYPLTPNGITKVFSVPKSVTSYLVTSDFPNVLFESTSTKNNGFTINATRTQITTTSDNAISDGAQLLYVYSEYFNS